MKSETTFNRVISIKSIQKSQFNKVIVAGAGGVRGVCHARENRGPEEHGRQDPVSPLTAHPGVDGHADAEARRSVLTALPCATLVTVPTSLGAGAGGVRGVCHARENWGPEEHGRQGPVHPTPHTLNPTPHTPHPTPHIPRPTPHTPHPAPYSPHPIPLFPAQRERVLY